MFPQRSHYKEPGQSFRRPCAPQMGHPSPGTDTCKELTSFPPSLDAVWSLRHCMIVVGWLWNLGASSALWVRLSLQEQWDQSHCPLGVVFNSSLQTCG